MKRLADYGFDDHPDDDDEEKARLAWSVVAMDDCAACNDLRIELTIEEAGRAGTGLAAHLSPDSARKVRAAIGQALRDIGEPPGP